MGKIATVSAVGALLLLSGCATAGDDGRNAGFSTCFVEEITEQIRWCMAGETSEDFYRASGRHQVIYGRFNNLAGLAKEGLSLCLTEQPERSYVNACRPEEVLRLAVEQIPFAEASTCEAVMDPRKSLMGC